MEVNINNQVGLDAILSVKIQESDYKEDFEKALKAYSHKMNVPGFRPGKIPMGMILKLIGKDTRHETVEKVLQKGISEYIESNNVKMLLSPLSTYHAEDIDWQQPDFEFTYDIGLQPVLNINLKPLNALTKYDVQASPDEVNKDINAYRTRFADVQQADEYENTGDYYVTLKFTELDESGQPLEGGLEKSKNYYNENTPPKLIEVINGKGMGFETIVQIADIFSEDEMAGVFEIDPLSIKDLFPDFKLRIISVLKLQLPEMDQEFFDREYQDGSVTTIEEYNERWKAEMEDRFNSQSDNVLSGDVKKALIDETKIDLPEQFIKKYFDLWVQENSGEMASENYEKELESFKKDLKWQVLSEQMAVQQSIEVKEEDVVSYAEALVYNALYRTNSADLTPEKLHLYTTNYLKKDNNYNSSAAAVRDGKVFDWLLSQIQPKHEAVSISEFEEIKSKSQVKQN